MNHSEFLEKYRKGLARAHINESDALQILNADIMPKRYFYAHTFWSWVWLLSLIIGIPIAIWVNRWVGIVIFILGLVLPRAIKSSASGFVLEYALENEDFYNIVIESESLRVEDVQH